MSNDGKGRHLSAAPSPAASSPTPGELRGVMGRFATGVTVITAAGEHGHGMTANSFTSVSLEPPLVLCCVAFTARGHAAITSAGGYGVTVLGAEQRDLARYFADKKRPLGAAQFDGVAHTPGPLTGAPLLDGALAWLECELVQTHDAGDHSIFVGRVLSARTGPAQRPLAFYEGGFRDLDGGAPLPRSA